MKTEIKPAACAGCLWRKEGNTLEMGSVNGEQRPAIHLHTREVEDWLVRTAIGVQSGSAVQRKAQWTQELNVLSQSLPI